MNTPNPMQRLGKALTAPSFIFPRLSVFSMLLCSSWLSYYSTLVCLLFDSFILCCCSFLAIQGTKLLARQHSGTTFEASERAMIRRRRRTQPDAPHMSTLLITGFTKNIYSTLSTCSKDIVCISFAVYLRNSYFCEFF